MKTQPTTTATVKFIIPPVELPKLTPRQIDNRVAKIEALDAEIKALQAQRDALKDEVTEAMTAATIETTRYTVRWTEVTSNRIDTKALKAAHPDICEEFTKATTARRFTYKAR